MSLVTGIERLAAVTGGEIASTFDKPELVNLGECALIDEIMVGEDKLIRFSGCKSGTACTIVLRGASSHLLGKHMTRFVHGVGCNVSVMKLCASRHCSVNHTVAASAILTCTLV